MRKRFKKKRKFKYKVIVYLFCVTLSIYLTTFVSNKLRLVISNQMIIENIFKNNNYVYKDKSNNHITVKLYSHIKENFFNSPVNLLKNELKMSEKEEKIEFMYAETSNPTIYIYNSHQGEKYSMEYLEDYNIVPDVLMASLMLKDKLESNNISSIVEESDILKYMKDNNLDYSGSYKASRIYLEKILNSYPNMDLYIDLHRDAATHKVSTTIINDKPCAKILFVIGLENSNYKKNLEKVTKLNNIILEKYPSLTRGIMKKQGYGVNGIYNQDLDERVILIEIGGHENNIEEINNTLDLIAEVIGEYLNEKK
ncbi:MAG: stage II sporulation protein P [Bacilli bacterium]|nr:stage II sporulation protein P [Bacilli bacterium]